MKYLGTKGHYVCNLPSNISEKKNVYTHRGRERGRELIRQMEENVNNRKIWIQGT